MKNLFLVIIIVFCFKSIGFSQSMISGHVIEMTTGLPIENATVFLNDEYNIALKKDIRTQTDQYGYYEFRDLEIKKYSVNAFVYYEYLGDSMAFVLQPGVVTLREGVEDSGVYNYITKDEESGDLVYIYTGFRLNFGFSEAYFRIIMNSSDEIDFSDVKDRTFYSSSRALLKPIIETNAGPQFRRHFSHYVEKKTW